MVAISSYFATVGTKIDDKSLKAVDAFLAKIDKKLESGSGKRGFSVTPKINMEGLEKQLRQSFRKLNSQSADKALRVSVGISERALRKSIASTVEKGTYRVPITAVLDKKSLSGIRDQIRNALQGISTTVSVNARTGKVASTRAGPQTSRASHPITAGEALTSAQLNTMRRQIASTQAGSRTGAAYWDNLGKLQHKTQQELLDVLKGIESRPKKNGWGFSWSPNSSGNPSNRAPNSPHLAEWLSGKPDKSSLSAANRRWSDSIMKEGFLGGTPNTFTGMLSEGVLGGLGRVGSSTMAGRGLGALGTTLGGARGGAVGLIGGAALSGITSSISGIWSGLGKMITTPFSLIGGAANAVTSSFYKLALAAAPLVASFMYINKRTQGITAQEIATDTTATRFGTTGAAEREWMYKMATKEGMRYEDMVMPYASFLAAYAPSAGVEASRDMFQSFSQYGRVHGATRDSSGRAFYALSQMSSKGTVMSEELNQQLAEAQGFSGVKSLVAEAYQMSLGRTGDQIKKNSEAMTELSDAMKKGQVKTDKVFPFLADLLKRQSAPGLATARESAGAQEDRFWNRMFKGWENFQKGGGEKGLALFWKDLQTSVGAWFEENGAWLGAKFESIMKWFKVFRIGLTDFVQFMWTGEHNSFTNWVASEWNLNLSSLRTFFADLWVAIKEISVNVASALGLLGKDGGVDFKQFGERFKNFATKVGEVVTHIRDMLYYLSHAFSQIGEILQGGVTGVLKTQLPGTRENNLAGAAITNLGYATGSFGKATGSAAQALTAPITPTDTPTPVPPTPYKLSQMVVGSGSSGMSPRQHKLMFPEMYNNRGEGVSAPTSIQNALPTTDWLSGTPKSATLDVNVKVEVTGDPENMKLFAAEEVARGISEQVPKMVDYSFNSKLVSAYTGARKF